MKTIMFIVMFNFTQGNVQSVPTDGYMDCHMKKQAVMQKLKEGGVQDTVALECVTATIIHPEKEAL